VDPVSALFLATIVAAVVMGRWGDVITGTAMGAVDHGRAQVASEARRAKQAVVDNTKASWRKRLEDGQAKGPKSAIWWGVAAARSARKVHRALRRAGDRSVSLPSAGPFRRVFDATAAGGRAGYRRARAAAKARKAARSGWRERARQAARNATAWRAAHRRDHATEDGVATGVCDRCGVTCAVAALEQEGALKLCALCRAPAAVDDTGTPDALPAPGAAVAAEDDEVVDGELIPVPALAGTTAAEGELMALDVRRDANGWQVYDKDSGQWLFAHTDRSVAIGGAQRALNPNNPGLSGAQAAPAALARRTAPVAHTAPAGMARTGDITTHGEGMRFSEAMIEGLDRMAQCKEAMLGGLTSVNAHEAQVRAIQVWADHERAVQGHWRSIIDTVDPRVRKFIDALNGEDRKVAGVIDHYSEV
jgi:hypothetical protein